MLHRPIEITRQTGKVAPQYNGRAEKSGEAFKTIRAATETIVIAVQQTVALGLCGGT